MLNVVRLAGVDVASAIHIHAVSKLFNAVT